MLINIDKEGQIFTVHEIANEQLYFSNTTINIYILRNIKNLIRYF